MNIDDNSNNDIYLTSMLAVMLTNNNSDNCNAMRFVMRTVLIILEVTLVIVAIISGNHSRLI